MDKTIKQTIDVQPGDRQWLLLHGESIDDLVGLVLEMFVDHRDYLLSPVLRKIVVEKAEQVKSQRSKLAGMNYCLDNPGNVLKISEKTEKKS